MGAISQAEVEKFAAYVIRTLGLDGWRMEWTRAQPGICLKKSQEILIPKSMIGQYPWQAKEYVLHETAHIFTNDKMHGCDFFREYIALLNKFMVEE